MSVKKIAFMLLLLAITMAARHAFAQAPFFKTVVYDKEKKGARLLKIFHDREGVMWLGTNLGVCRYDGISFRYLEKDSNMVSSIAQDNNGVLWMGHDNGRLEYTDHLLVKKFTARQAMPVSKITAIIFDKQNRMWLGTYGEGVYCYANDTLRHISYSDGLPDNTVYDLMLDDDNSVWAATDMGIAICRISNGKKVTAVIDRHNGLPDNIVRLLKKDSNGNTWIGLQDKGVCYKEKQSGNIVVPPETANWQYGQVNDILPMKNEVLIGTEENGIIEIHPGLPVAQRMMPARNKKLNSVQQLLCDRNEQVWVVADNVLRIANSNRFQTIEIPLQWQDAIKAITTDNTGRIWFANKKGIFTKKDNNSPVEQFSSAGKLDYSSIISLYADVANDIWIGTYNNGLYRYKSSSGQLTHYNNLNGLIDNNIFSIAGHGNELWLGTLGGASKIDINTDPPLFENYNRQNGLSNNFIYNISIDNNNNKWFSTDGSGISRLDNTGFEHYNHIAGLEKNIAYTSTTDIYGNLWFTGLNSGLFCFDGFKFKHYSIRDGMNDNEILNVVADNKGNLLLSHPDGLELFNIKKEAFTFFGAESGFDNIKPEINAWCKTQGGEVLIGSTEKIIRYYAPDSSHPQLPQLVLNDVEVLLNSAGTRQNQQFRYNQNYITFNFAGLWYINPDAVNYEYKLEGYSKAWISTKDHIITFPQLPPGTYTFLVKTAINNDFHNSPLLSYRFTILKPFWKTTWFIITAILLTAAVIFYFVRLRIRMANFKQEKENQKLVAQLAVLKNQLNPHFLFNSFNTLMNIIDKDQQMAIEYAEKLADFYREVLLMQDREMVTLSAELELLNNYVYLQQKRFGNNLQLQINISAEQLKAGIPPLTLQLLAENALKHNIINTENPLTIRIESAQSFLLVSNNINRHEMQVISTGTGLKNIQQRIQLLTGKEVQVIKTANEFNIVIPLKTN